MKVTITVEMDSAAFDGSPRYSYIVPGKVEGEGYIACEDGPDRWTATVWAEKEAEYPGGIKARLYYGRAFDGYREHAVLVGPFRSAKEAKEATVKALEAIMPGHSLDARNP